MRSMMRPEQVSANQVEVPKIARIALNRLVVERIESFFEVTQHYRPLENTTLRSLGTYSKAFDSKERWACLIMRTCTAILTTKIIPLLLTLRLFLRTEPPPPSPSPPTQETIYSGATTNRIQTACLEPSTADKRKFRERFGRLQKSRKKQGDLDSTRSTKL